jgi:hypothetical protein
MKTPCRIDVLCNGDRFEYPPDILGHALLTLRTIKNLIPRKLLSFKEENKPSTNAVVNNVTENFLYIAEINL